MLEDGYQMLPVSAETISSDPFWIYELMSLVLKTFICFIVKENSTVWLTKWTIFDILFAITEKHIA